MNIQLLYVHDCPNWSLVDERLNVIAEERPDITVTRHVVTTTVEAERLGFHGSPSILVNGVDPFATEGADIALACRLYTTPDGPAGAPTLAQLRTAITQATGDGYDGQRDDPMTSSIAMMWTCRWARRRIQRYLDSDPAAPLTGRETRRLEAHLAVCERCGALTGEYRGLRRALALWANRHAPDPAEVARLRRLARRLPVEGAR